MQKIFFFISLIISQFAFSQEIDGKICGKVLDNTGQPAPYAAVMLMQGETVINGAYTDDTGFYSIQPIDSGRYDIKAQVLEVVEITTAIVVGVGETKVVDINFKKSPKDEVHIPICHWGCWRRPPFKKEQPSGVQVLDEELQKMADRRLSASASLATGVYVPIK
ncbi:MAG: carboxypeptidase-like regulatory domain-containing protein [Bacteroidia bacterium]